MIYGATDEAHFRTISQIPPEFVGPTFQPPNSVYADVISEYKPFLRGNAKKHGQFMSDGYAFSIFITIHKELSRRRY